MRPAATHPETPSDDTLLNTNSGKRSIWDRVLTGDLSFATGLLICVALVAAFFNKTVFLGKPISRISLITHWDSLFNQFRQGANLNIDPSAVILGLPDYTLVANCYHALSLPLWNSYNAFGLPLVGDIQAAVFSPLRILFNLFPSMYTYNLQLVTQVAVAALGTLLLARILGASLLSAIFAACAFAFCPFMLYYLELQSGIGFVLYPTVMWAFVRLAQHATWKAAVVAGIVSGITILIGHPETSFLAITTGTLLCGALLWKKASAARFATLIAVAGISAVCVCAPVFFPFIEYMRNSDCYKYAITESAYVPWFGVLYSMLAPGFGGASPFMGILVPVLMPFAFLNGADDRRNVSAVAIAGLLSLILTAKLWPFSMVAKQAPFSYLLTVYALPIFLLCACVLAALGLDRLYQLLRQDNRGMYLVAMLLVAGSWIVTPYILHASHFDLSIGNFDMTMPGMAFSESAFKRDLIALVAFALVGISAVATRNSLIATALVATALIANFISVGSVAKASLPSQADFQFPKLEVTEALKNSGDRMIAIGTHLLKPDMNLIYSIDDVRSVNPMFPSGYIGFVKACGAITDEYGQRFGEKLTATLDLASVKYIISQTPITCQQENPAEIVPLSSIQNFPVQLTDKLLFTGGGIWSDWKNASAGGFVNFMGCDDPSAANLRAVVLLTDRAGNVLHLSDQLPVKNPIEFTLPLPGREFKDCIASLRIFHVRTGQPVNIMGKDTVLIATVPPSTSPDRQSRYVLKREFPDRIRLYENTAALPRAYLIFDGVLVGDQGEAHRHIRSMDFDPRSVVILERPADLTGITGGQQLKEATVVSRSHNEVVIRCSAPQAGFLVLTDTFYPGWIALVDGKDTPIYRANSLFRAVSVSPGDHTVVFKYQPLSFIVGAVLNIGFWLFVAATLLLSWRRGKRAETTSD